VPISCHFRDCKALLVLSVYVRFDCVILTVDLWQLVTFCTLSATLQQRIIVNFVPEFLGELYFQLYCCWGWADWCCELKKKLMGIGGEAWLSWCLDIFRIWPRGCPVMDRRSPQDLPTTMYCICIAYFKLQMFMPNTHRRRRVPTRLDCQSRRVASASAVMCIEFATIAHDDCWRIRSTTWKLDIAVWLREFWSILITVSTMTSLRRCQQPQ